MIRPIEFETERLALRVWRDEHRAPFAEMNLDTEVMRYFPALITPDQSNASVDYWLSLFAERGFGMWAVELRASGEFLGFIGLSVPRAALPFAPCVEIGWRLKRAAWKQGYATEGARECLRVGFEQFGLAEIVSFTALVNLPSIAVMERIGMQNAGEDFDHPAVPEGHVVRRHCLYKITREDWGIARGH